MSGGDLRAGREGRRTAVLKPEVRTHPRWLAGRRASRPLPARPVPATDGEHDPAAPVERAAGGHDQKRFLSIVALAGLGFGMTAPLTVLFAAELGANDLVAGLTVSAVALSLLVVDIFGTRLVPRVDGRFAIWFSLTVFGLGSLASAVTPGLKGMIGARVFQGLGAAFFLGGALSAAVRLAPASRSGQAIGIFNAAWFGGVAASPLAGGYLAALGTGTTGYRLAFAACGLVCFAVALGARLLLPSIPSPGRPKLGLPRPARPRPGLRVWPPLVLAAIGQAVRGGLVMTIIPWLGERELGLSVGTVGAGLAVLAVVDIVAMQSGGALGDRHGRRPVLVGALLSGAAACLLTPLVSGWWSFGAWCAACGAVVGVSWVVPAAVVVDVVSEREAGLANYRIAADVGQLLGASTAGAAMALLGVVRTGVAVGFGFVLLSLWVATMRETAVRHHTGRAVGDVINRG